MATFVLGEVLCYLGAHPYRAKGLVSYLLAVGRANAGRLTLECPDARQPDGRNCLGRIPQSGLPLAVRPQAKLFPQR